MTISNYKITNKSCLVIRLTFDIHLQLNCKQNSTQLTYPSIGFLVTSVWITEL